MDEPQGYRSIGTKGGLCGCMAAAAFGFTVAFPLLFVWAWSGAHCEPAPECLNSVNLMLLTHLAPILALAALLGFAIRALVNWWVERNGSQEGAKRPPVWAVAAVIVVGAVFVWGYQNF